MPLLRDEVYRLIAVAKGDIPASAKQRREADTDYRALLDEWTQELQRASPGDLSITHDSVEEAVENAYRQHRRRKNHVATRRLLQDKD